VVLALVVSACIGHVEGSPPPTPRQAQSLPPPRIAEPIEFLLGSEQGQFRAVPGSGDAAAGVLYRYQLYSHCGLAYPLAWDFDGSFWDPVGGGEPYANPPEGIGSGFDDGTIELTGEDEARYTSSQGLVIPLRRSEDTERRGFLCV
jgi:hypothetical protein